MPRWPTAEKCIRTTVPNVASTDRAVAYDPTGTWDPDWVRWITVIRTGPELEPVCYL
jgi:hypothetical protein